MPPIRLISLDAFETLISPRFPPSEVYARAARKLINVKVKPQHLAPLYSDSYLYYRKKYPNFGSYDGISACDWWGKVIRRALSPFLTSKQEVPDSFCASLFEQYNSAQLWTLEPSALACLQAIQRMKPKRYLCVLSNFDERLPRILSELEIDKYFDDILFSCAFPFHKPDDRFFRALLDRYPAVPPEQCLHVGNSLERDYIAALQVGMQARLFNANRDEVEKSVETITSLAELLPLIETSA